MHLVKIQFDDRLIKLNFHQVHQKVAGVFLCKRGKLRYKLEPGLCVCHGVNRV